MSTQDLKLEAIVVPVTDVDRAKTFYERLGWRLDADFAFDDGFRVVQFTPPGSPASVQFGTRITTAEPGSAQGLYLVVADIDAARKELESLGAPISDVFHVERPGAQFAPGEPAARLPGKPSEGGSYGTFATFADPDGNVWLLQEVTTRLPGRIGTGSTAYASENELELALKRAAAAHGKHEERTGRPDENWPSWYARYMVAEQTGEELPS